MTTSVAQADLLLSVDFDPDEEGIQSTANLVEGQILRAAFVLTGDELVAQYKFSVQFDVGALRYRSRTDPLPKNWTPLTTINKPTPLVGEVLIRRFDGQNFRANIDLPPIVASNVPYVLGTVEFDIISSIAPTGNLLMPGLFESTSDDLGFDVPDDFWGLDSLGSPIPVSRAGLRFSGGGITAVPEPGSFLLLAGGGALWAVAKRRKMSLRKRLATR